MVASQDWSILWPALVAGLLVTATHVPLGMQVLNRGIVFIDLAIAQIAGLGVVFAHALGFEPQGWAVQACALAAALAGSLLLTWTDRRWPEVQEATIGVSFVLAATGSLLLLAQNPHGGEHLRDLLVGQVIWVRPGQLAIVLVAYGVLAIVMSLRRFPASRALFYLVFAGAATISVQLVGLYLVFATLIVPALATRRCGRHRMWIAYSVGALGYGFGLVVSLRTDLPAGPAIVWMMVALAILFAAMAARSSLAYGKGSRPPPG